MFIRHKVLSLLLIAASTIIVPRPSPAAVDIDINVGPPALRVEAPPSPRRGFVWAPGYWRWAHGRHVWVAGRWLRERPGYHWVPETWVQVGPRWHFQRGHWEQ